MTMEELRLAQEEVASKAKAREEYLNEEVLVANVTFPVEMQRELGIPGYWIKLDELQSFLAEEFENENAGLFTVKIKRKTNRWVENLPEYDA